MTRVLLGLLRNIEFASIHPRSVPRLKRWHRPMLAGWNMKPPNLDDLVYFFLGICSSCCLVGQSLEFWDCTFQFKRMNWPQSSIKQYSGPLTRQDQRDPNQDRPSILALIFPDRPEPNSQGQALRTPPESPPTPAVPTCSQGRGRCSRLCRSQAFV